MTNNDEYKELFEDAQNAVLKQNAQMIVERIANQQDKVIIATRDVAFTDLGPRRRDPNYLAEEHLKEVEYGISVLYPTQELVDMIKDEIPLTIKELTIPVHFISDIKYLERFKELEVLTVCTPCIITPEQIEYIRENTNIKKINVKSTHTINELKGKPGATVISGGNTIADYKGIEINFTPNTPYRWTSSLTIHKDNFTDISSLKRLYDKISSDLPPITYVSFEKEQFTPEPNVSFSIQNKEVPNLKLGDLTPTEAATIYQAITSHVPVRKTVFKCNNQTYEDIDYLELLNHTSSLTIQYEKERRTSSTLDAFISMRATIDYYKDLINSYDLSPVEKIAYVYDLLKSWKYQENENDKSSAREIHKIIEDGNIVCVGYTLFAEQLITELGTPVLALSVTTPNDEGKVSYHERNLIRVDDDKYNIHGLYVLDITWDSDRDITIIEENGQRTVVGRPDEGDKIVDSYDSLSLYRHFLIPLSDYEKRYPNDSIPPIIEEYKNGDLNRVIEDNTTKKQHKTLFNLSEDPLVIESYVTAPKPSLETFEQILKNVRIAEGYTEEEATIDVERVVELHKMLNDQNGDRPNTFFKPSQTK